MYDWLTLGTRRDESEGRGFDSLRAHHLARGLTGVRRSRERRAGGPVNTFKLIALVVLVAVGATLMQPGQAEAIDPLTAITIAGAAVLVVTVIVVVVIANMREREGGAASEATVVAFDSGGVQGL